MSKLKFEELNLSEEMLDAIKSMGFEEASPIQSEAIPVILQGKDIVGQAQTGTGKTAAFGIPVIEKLDSSSKDLQAVILCPTRELVIQVAEEFRKLMKYKKKLFVTPIYGGQQIETQLKALKKGTQVVIGTPGRTMDHIRRGSIDMETVQTIVLDEADEMLDMGFREDLEFILKDTSSERQTIMFSATMAKDILELTKTYQNDPVIINVAKQALSAPKIQQVYFEVQEKNKPEALARLIDVHNVKLALVFCNTKSQVDQLVEILKTRGYFADALHGDMSQMQRDKVMRGFRKGTVEILVATDVAGRGIDVNNVEAVFNYDLPRDDEDYIHRIGRTGRAGKTGMAFTFVNGKQIYNLRRIERANGMQIHRQNIPTIDEIEATRVNYYIEKITETITAGHLSKYINHIDLLMGEEHTSLDVAAALLKMAMEKDNEGFDEQFDLEPQEEFREEPRGNRRGNGGRSGGRGFDRKRSEGRDSGFKSRKRSDSDKPAFKSDRKFSDNSEKSGFRKRNDSDRPSFKSDKKFFDDADRPAKKPSRKKKDNADNSVFSEKKVYKDTGFRSRKKEEFSSSDSPKSNKKSSNKPFKRENDVKRGKKK